MSESSRPRSTFQFLRVAGAVNTWFVFVFLVFAAWIVYLLMAGEDTSVCYFFLFLFPLAVGTGLLSAARRGNLDFLFGTGETRSSLWWFAFGYAWGVPSLMAMVVMWLSGPPHVSNTLARLVAVLLFTGGISFSAGLVETRYFVGVIWFVGRMVFFLTPAGMTTLKQLHSGISLPKGTLAIVVLVAPESALGQHMPIAYLIGCALVGLTALVGSYRWFGTADFGGKRS